MALCIEPVLCFQSVLQNLSVAAHNSTLRSLYLSGNLRACCGTIQSVAEHLYWRTKSLARSTCRSDSSYLLVEGENNRYNEVAQLEGVRFDPLRSVCSDAPRQMIDE